jgi:cyclase
MRTQIALLLTMLAGGVIAAETKDFSDVRVTSNPVGGSVSMISGAGGNLAVSIGADGTLLVDDQFAPLAPRILSAIEELGGTAPKLIVNTHFHDDHVGGNAALGEHGVIIAQEQVRYRLLNEATWPRAALPIVTFDDRIRIHFNDDEIDIIHLPSGHTDGDAVVWFRNANVLHTGDLFFNGIFPYIDLDSGGSVDGYLADVARLLEMVPADTRIIPGHGPLANIVALGEFHDMLKSTITTVEKRISNGESVESITSSGLGPEWARFATGFVDEEGWIKTIYQSTTRPSESEVRRR